MASERISTIDAFRGFAVLAVVLSHYTARIPYDVMGYEYPMLPGLWSWGWIGPYWFFIISGFCMVGSIRKSTDAIAFLAKRLSRIYPAYVVALVLILIFGYFVTPLVYEPWGYSSAKPPFVDVVANLFFATDLGFDFVDGAFWTLVVELKFYLFLAITFFTIFARDIGKTVVAFGVASLILSVLWLALRFFPDELPFVGTLTNAILTKVLIAPYVSFFALGLLVQQFLSTKNKKFLALILPITLLTCIIIAVRKAESHYAYEDTTRTVSVYIGALLVMFFTMFNKQLSIALQSRIANVLLPPLTRIGVVSYAWYLVHQDIGMTTIYHLNAFLPGWLSLVLVVIGTYTLAEIISATVEWRFRQNFEHLIVKLARVLLPPYGVGDTTQSKAPAMHDQGQPNVKDS